LTMAAKFFKRLLRRFVRLWMARPYRETGEVEPFQYPAHLALAD